MNSNAQTERSEILDPGNVPRVYTRAQIMELLGIRSKSTYGKLINPDSRGRILLHSSRLYPGGPRRHTQKQYEDYLEYLNTSGVVGAQVGGIAAFQSRAAARR